MLSSVTSADSALMNRISSSMRDLRASNSDFDFALETYVQQYGEDKISLEAKPINLARSIDPVSLIFGRNCTVQYSDSSKALHGNLGRIELKRGQIGFLGRRQPQDQKLVCWTTEGEEIDLTEYNSRASIIPSRVHGALNYEDDDHVFFLDLGSSSGSVIVGESPSLGPFVRVYDPGENFPSINFERVILSKK